MSRNDVIRSRKIKAWLLIIALGPLFLVKSFHYHHHQDFNHDHTHSCTNHEDAINKRIISFSEAHQLSAIHNCAICDFTLSAFTNISLEVLDITLSEYKIVVIKLPTLILFKLYTHFFLRGPPNL